MSIIGFELFRKITNTQGIENPSEILNTLNADFAEIFRDVSDFTLRDGMDMAFCVFDKKTRILEYSGAFNPLYIIRDNKISEIKGDRFSVGIETFPEEQKVFKNHSIALEHDDMVFIFSDGYADQFGGPEGKKYKYRRFRHLLLTIHKLPLEVQRDLLQKSIMEWKGELDQVDDILVIGFKP
jgi:serine phosphatase RsbU (regulator of sigma subunit)